MSATSTAETIKDLKATLDALFNAGEMDRLEQALFLLQAAELEERARHNLILEWMLTGERPELPETSTKEVIASIPPLLKTREAEGTLGVEEKFKILIAVARLEEIAESNRLCEHLALDADTHE